MKNKFFKYYRQLFGVMGALTGILVVPVLLFFKTFHSPNFSENISDWANFGDFIGGTLGPLISYFSLILLGFLTYLVSKDSTDQAYSHQINLKKIEAYQKLVTGANNLEIYIDSFERFADSIEFVSTRTNNYQVLSNTVASEKGTVITSILNLKLYIIEFKNFETSYGKLFKYNFSNQRYLQLITSLEEINKLLNAQLLYFKSFGIDLISDQLISEKLKTSYNLKSQRELSDTVGELLYHFEELKISIG